jgi:hypothetical protein|tara:strand:- start:1611 stop:2006 length:396 start_codon:yes stop_codon:yes gene_type:complete
MTKNQLWEEVKRDIHIDKFFTNDTTYCLYNGCKISYRSGEVDLYNCNTGGNTFAPLSLRQMQPFLKYGFKVGTEYLALDNVRTEVMLLDVLIRKCERESNILDLLKLKKRKTLLSNLIKSSYYANTKEKHV